MEEIVHRGPFIGLVNHLPPGRGMMPAAIFFSRPPTASPGPLQHVVETGHDAGAPAAAWAPQLHRHFGGHRQQAFGCRSPRSAGPRARAVERSAAETPAARLRTVKPLTLITLCQASCRTSGRWHAAVSSLPRVAAYGAGDLAFERIGRVVQTETARRLR